MSNSANRMIIEYMKRNQLIGFLNEHNISIDSAIDILNHEKYLEQQKQNEAIQKRFLEAVMREAPSID